MLATCSVLRVPGAWAAQTVPGGRIVVPLHRDVWSGGLVSLTGRDGSAATAAGYGRGGDGPAAVTRPQGHAVTRSRGHRIRRPRRLRGPARRPTRRWCRAPRPASTTWRARCARRG
ncbi:hypothetical protein ACGRHY_18350 [Streptomyces sp. HK10]|uniref:hypothetical protein n=1 Tax=Streptomyces sp. HK10 TaxID=3373255 RepID=UPI0037494228